MKQNFVELLVDGHRVLPSLLEDLARAEHSIHVSVFLFFRDPVGLEIASVLEERSRNGVAVRVLLNMEKTAMGDPFSTGEKRMMTHDPAVDYNPLDVGPMCESMRRAGITVIDSDIDYDHEVEVADPRLTSIAAQIRGSIAVDELHIDHRKLVVIDGRVAYCGGANFGAQYLFHVPFDAARDARDEGAARKAEGLPEPWWKWHDSLTRFEGPVVDALELAFRERWLLDGGQEYPPHMPYEANEARLAASPTGPAEPRSKRGLPVADARVYCNAPNDQPNAVRELYLGLIKTATRSIFIENPYLYHPAIVDALVEAKTAQPELDVVLVVPSDKHNDNSFAQDAQQHHYPRFVECGIRVYEYLNHFNHLKIAVFDERWSIHGSTNLNYRSLEDDKDFELVVLVDDAAVARAVLTEVRDVDIGVAAGEAASSPPRSRPITRELISGHSLEAIRMRTRDPRTLLLLSRHLL